MIVGLPTKPIIVIVLKSRYHYPAILVFWARRIYYGCAAQFNSHRQSTRFLSTLPILTPAIQKQLSHLIHSIEIISSIIMFPSHFWRKPRERKKKPVLLF